VPEPAASVDPPTNVPAYLVVNTSELVERLAYYGVLSVNALYLASIGYSATVIGLLSAILLPLPYVVPLLAGPLAEKLGYKRVMLAAFVAYAAGFLLIGLVASLPALVGGIVLVGVGAGMFKPLTVAAVAHVTSLKHRTFAYSVYYVGINVGGFIGPLLMATLGHHYRLAFLVGAAAIAADFVLVLLLFRSPVEPQPHVSVLRAFRPLLEVLGDLRFVVLLAIFAGFWALYSMNFTFIILYLQAYVARPAFFTPGLQVSLESLCVVLLGVPLGRVASGRDGVRMMTVGIALLTAGFLLLGLVRWFPAYVAGVVLVAAGEVLAYPGFLSYVSRIAPKGRVAVYQGTGFLPLFAGFLVGPILAGPVYQSVVQTGRRPSLFWALMALIGVATLAAFLLYARALRPAAERAPWWQGRPAAALVAAAGVVLVLVGVAAGSAVPLPPDSGGPSGSIGHAPPGMVLAKASGTATSGGPPSAIQVQLPANTTANVTFVLAWSDEGPASPLPGATNQPDSFTLGVACNDRSGRGGSAHGANPQGAQGTVTLTLRCFHPGAVNVTVEVQSQGTVFAGQTVAPDGGNSWSLQAIAGPA